MKIYRHSIHKSAPVQGQTFFVQISPESVLPHYLSENTVNVVVIRINFTGDIETVFHEVDRA